jgi:3-oxo-5-alpha-steroid 4-dehydrogenase 1
LFVIGLVINFQSDLILIKLRQPGETGYKLPTGGFFRWLSCSNYFGELLEWTGWALATWSLPGLAFAVWGAANLVPRAVSHHRWYQEKFPNYPRERRALLPGVL